MSAAPALDRLVEQSFLLFGYGRANRAVSLALLGHGRSVVVADDGDAAVGDQVLSDGATYVSATTTEEIERLVAAVDAVVPTPGLAEAHPLFSVAKSQGVPILSEFDIAAGLDNRPMVSITGTNGKTTVTLLATEMLQKSGFDVAAVGNTEVPLVEAIGDSSFDIFVVEASSFRLARTRSFNPLVATWTNFAPDHLDVHSSLESYELAKARSWKDLQAESFAVANLDDETVAAHVGEGAASFVTYGRSEAREFPHYSVSDRGVSSPEGDLIVDARSLSRSLPHDLSNAAAAAATARLAGASDEAIAEGASSYRHLPHRVESLGVIGGVEWVNDSKATAPHATIAAAQGYDSVVLIAGGRNKGLELSELAVLAPRLRGVVGLGEAGPEISAVFPTIPTEVAADMETAVDVAQGIAQSGDVVLLSPACASFDSYSSYSERGDDFRRLVLEMAERHG